MLKQTELNAYLGVLKAIAKTNKLETLKGLAIKDGNLEATNLEITATLYGNIKSEEGIYNSQIADLFKVDRLADLAPYKVKPIEDWAEEKEQDTKALINLDLRTSRGTLAEIICHAADFVSTDATRPALTCVWAQNSEIVATDGYRAYASSDYPELENSHFSLTSDLLKQFKKIAKFGGWKLYEGDSRVILANDHFRISAPLCPKDPPIVRNLLNSNRHFAYKVVLPYKQIKVLASKANHELEIKQDGTLLLNSLPLPIKAEVYEHDYEYDLDGFRAVLCGLVGKATRLDTTLLGAFKSDKSGNLTLRINFGDPLYGVVEPW